MVRPKSINILGVELSDTVEVVGSEVSKYQIGDRVFADTGDDNCGAHAE